MNKILASLFALLMMCSVAFGQQRLTGPQRGIPGGAGDPLRQPGIGVTTSSSPCADSSCTGFLVCQNFEGTGYDNSESWTESCGSGATCDEDSTDSPLRGSQSYLFTAGTGASSTYVSFTAQDEIYFFMRFTFSADTTGNIFYIRNSTTALFFASYNSTNNKLYYNSATLGATVLTPGTTYYLWGYYKKGSGADEINRSWIGTTTSKPESVDYELTNGSSTEQANRISIDSTASGPNTKYDQILVKTTEIGDVCE